MHTQHNNVEHLLKLSRAKASNKKFDAPEPFEFLPYQNAGIEYALNFKNVLFADEPGLGKSAQALGTMNERGFNKALIVCPASLRDATWPGEIQKFSKIKDPKIIVLKKLKDIPLHDDWNFLICSYNFVSKRTGAGYHKGKKVWNYPHLDQLVLSANYECLIFDEIHNLKSPTSVRTRACLAKNGIRSKAENVYSLTGTPIVNRPMDIYPVVKALMPHAIQNMDQFKFGMRYCNGFKRNLGYGKLVWDFGGASNLPELGKLLRANGMLRRRKKDVLTELPPKIRNIITIENDAAISAEYYDEDVSMGALEKLDITEASEKRLEAGLSKVKFSIDYIKTQLEGGHEKVIVFAHHKEVIKQLQDGLKEYGVVTLTGSTKSEDRFNAVNDFQLSKNIRVFLGQITAAGTGLTLTAASYVCIVEPSWDPATNIQAEDRPHRVGQKDSVLIDYIVHKDSIDARIVKKLSIKTKNIEKLME